VITRSVYWRNLVASLSPINIIMSFLSGNSSSDVLSGVSVTGNMIGLVI
jgi:hypothetical protein